MGPQGPVGPTGPAGPAGPTGPKGATGPLASGNNATVTSTTTFTITGAVKDIFGSAPNSPASLTIPTGPNHKVMVTAQVELTCTGSSGPGNNCSNGPVEKSRILMDGVAQGLTFPTTIDFVGDDLTLPNQVLITNVAPGSHTFTLTVTTTSGGGSDTVQARNAILTVIDLGP